MSAAAFDCQLCSDSDCDAAFVVSAPRDDSYTSDYEVLVGRACVRAAERHVEGQDGVVGLAQVDPIFYGAA